MAERSRIHALRRIADTSRKFTSKKTTPRAARTTTPNTSTVFESLPEHKPLLPLLLSHNIPSRLAKACADKYDSYAKQLKSAAETKFAPYLFNCRSHTPNVYYVFLESYAQMLQDWAQSVLNVALKSLKRDFVDLQNLDVTYPRPLWFPLPPDQYPTFVPKGAEEPCPLSSASAPPHAFPTTYPPPLRPASPIPLVEWLRTPATSSCSPSASTIDLDSLCLQFTKSLVISENLTQQPQQKASMFSLPAIWKEGGSSDHSRTKPLKRNLSAQRSQYPLPPIPTSTIPPLKVVKTRRLSVPPSFPLPYSKTKPTPRKASAPARVPIPKRATASSKRSDSTYHSTPTTSPSPPGDPTTDRLETSSYSPPSTPPLYHRSSPNSAVDQATPTLPGSPNSPTGPNTPPVLPPDLFSEPIVVPSTPVHLSPGTSLMPITDPFLQFQSQYDYFSDPCLISSFDYNGLAHGLATGSFCSKIPIAPDPFEYNFSSPYAVS